MSFYEEFLSWYHSEPNSLIYIIVSVIILLIILKMLFGGKNGENPLSFDKLNFMKMTGKI